MELPLPGSATRAPASQTISAASPSRGGDQEPGGREHFEDLRRHELPENRKRPEANYAGVRGGINVGNLVLGDGLVKRDAREAAAPRFFDQSVLAGALADEGEGDAGILAERFAGVQDLLEEKAINEVVITTRSLNAESRRAITEACGTSHVAIRRATLEPVTGADY